MVRGTYRGASLRSARGPLRWSSTDSSGLSTNAQHRPSKLAARKMRILQFATDSTVLIDELQDLTQPRRLWAKPINAAIDRASIAIDGSLRSLCCERELRKRCLESGRSVERLIDRSKVVD
mmetsp:Transcript_11521/g.22664  ORF Transcript_11521/g.22664 Transcript_11521/m.22664 type:complete len:121 (-) Transcript_11521:294-656(-)